MVPFVVAFKNSDHDKPALTLSGLYFPMHIRQCAKYVFTNQLLYL